MLNKTLNPNIFDKEVEKVPTRDGMGKGLVEAASPPSRGARGGGRALRSEPLPRARVRRRVSSMRCSIRIAERRELRREHARQ